MVLPRVTESLAGRMETLALLPLSQGEIHGVNNKWIDMVFAGQVPVPDRPLRGSDLVEAVLCGGYPEVLSRSSHRRRSVWIKQYLDALIQRDVQDIVNVEKLTMLPQFFTSLISGSRPVVQLCPAWCEGGSGSQDIFQIYDSVRADVHQPPEIFRACFDLAKWQESTLRGGLILHDGERLFP